MSGDGHLQVLVLVEVIRRSVSLPVEEARVERSTSAWSREEEMRRGGGRDERTSEEETRRRLRVAYALRRPRPKKARGMRKHEMGSSSG